MRLLTFNVYPSIPGPLSPTAPIFAKLNALKVDDIYNHQVSKFVFKCIYRLTTEQFHDWYKLTCGMHEHSTRSNFNVNEGIVINNLFAPSANTSNYGLKQLKVSGPRIWNKLPSDLKNVSSLNVFLKKLKLYYRYIKVLINLYTVNILVFSLPDPSFFLLFFFWCFIFNQIIIKKFFILLFIFLD